MNRILFFFLTMNTLAAATPLRVRELPDGPLPWGDGHLVVVAANGLDGVTSGNESFLQFVEDTYAN